MKPSRFCSMITTWFLVVQSINKWDLNAGIIWISNCGTSIHSWGIAAAKCEAHLHFNNTLTPHLTHNDFIDATFNSVTEYFLDSIYDHFFWSVLPNAKKNCGKHLKIRTKNYLLDKILKQRKQYVSLLQMHLFAKNLKSSILLKRNFWAVKKSH